MKTSMMIAALTALPLLAACGHYDPPPMAALDTDCFAGARHGPTGAMDWTCIDGDGEQRLRPVSLHKVIKGDIPPERERRPLQRASRG